MDLGVFLLISVIYFASTIAQDDTSAEESDEFPLIFLAPKVGFRGIRVNSVAGDFYSFRGIRYAQPPVGALRFKPPESITNRRPGIFNVTTPVAPCIQADPYSQGGRAIKGKEDCLFLDVYTTKLIRDDEPLPVMIWIHGGGFQGGQPHPYRPDHLLNKEVVVVAIQYRVGPLGFLSTGTSAMGGNYGLQDQVAAMQWVQQNIEFFGGDKERVTLFGTDAGAISIGLHLVSPQSKGLFHAAILQSGSPLAPYSVQTDPMMQIKQVAKGLGCSPDPEDALVMCIKGKEAKDIISAELKAQESLSLDGSMSPPFTSSPVVMEPFLPLAPGHVLRSGKEWNYVPVVIGVTQDEGANDVINLLMPQLLNKTDVIRDAFLPSVASVIKMKQNQNMFMETLRFQYFLDDELQTVENLERPLIKLHSDMYVTSPAWETAWRLSDSAPVFFYGFDYSGLHPLINLFPKEIKSREGEPVKPVEEEKPKLPIRKGTYVMHGEELLYLFRFQHPLTKEIIELEDETDLFVRDLVTTLWTNTAKHGMPVPPGTERFPPWPPMTPSSKRRPFYRLGSLPGPQPVFLQRRMAFWDHFVPRLQEQKMCK